MRRRMLALRQGIAGDERVRLERSILERILALPSYLGAERVALYMPIRGEVNLLPLWKPEKRQFFFPRVSGGHLAFSSAGSLQDFVEGAYGILEPTSDRTVEASEIDVIFVPGLAFDRYGYRLGYGKGYYDRLIGGCPDTLFIGVCPKECCIERLPVDPWDARVGFVVTQAGIYKEGEV